MNVFNVLIIIVPISKDLTRKALIKGFILGMLPR